MWILRWDSGIPSLEISPTPEDEERWQEPRRREFWEGGGERQDTPEEEQSARAGHWGTRSHGRGSQEAKTGEKTREETHADVIWLSGEPETRFLLVVLTFNSDY